MASINAKKYAVIKRYIFVMLFVQRVFNADIISVCICVIKVTVDHVMLGCMAMCIVLVVNKRK